MAAKPLSAFVIAMTVALAASPIAAQHAAGAAGDQARTDAQAQDRLREARIPIMAFQREASMLHRRVQSDPYFGGLIIRSSPEPHAIVMFTRDAEARLHRYTLDPRFRALRVELTLAELEAMKDRVSAQLSRLDLRCLSVDGDEEHNVVTVRTLDVDKVQRAVAAGRLRLEKTRFLPGRCTELR